ncbi:LppA family lipoprotein [Saccharopolyspora taberi]|uniref:Lipoprotein n=1 Tax=Saccharopolyspora taberi TaxID=60895 RepID=A0ABN3VKH9_9PSEU
MRLGKALPLIAGGALLAACATPSAPNDEGPMEDPRAALRQRPSIEEISARYDQMQQRLRDRLSAEVGAAGWEVSAPVSRAGCTELPEVHDAESWVLDSWKSPGNLPDAEWSRAVAIVGEVTGEYGFGAPEAVVDRPGDHEITAKDPFGAVYQFGTASNTMLMVSTGCHLLRSAHG